MIGPPQWLGPDNIGNRNYPAHNHLTICKQLLFVGWHYICL